MHILTWSLIKSHSCNLKEINKMCRYTSMPNWFFSVVVNLFQAFQLVITPIMLHLLNNRCIWWYVPLVGFLFAWFFWLGDLLFGMSFCLDAFFSFKTSWSNAPIRVSEPQLDNPSRQQLQITVCYHNIFMGLVHAFTSSSAQGKVVLSQQRTQVWADGCDPFWSPSSWISLGEEFAFGWNSLGWNLKYEWVSCKIPSDFGWCKILPTE